MRRIAAAIAVAALPAAASAQEAGRATWSELLTPDRVTRGLVQYGILLARTQADITYGDLAVDLSSGRVALSEVVVYPFVDWGQGKGFDGPCRIDIDTLTLRGQPWGTIVGGAGGLEVSGLRAGFDCVPPDSRLVLGLAGLSEISVPSAGVEYGYDVPRSSASLRVHGSVEGLGALELAADMPYVWFELPTGEDADPLPIVYLSRAALTFEDDGAFAALRPLLPPEATDPATAEAFARDAATEAVIAALTDALGIGPDTLTGPPAAFVDSAATAWAEFVVDPRRIALETGELAEPGVYLDFAGYGEDTALVFQDLAPRAVPTPTPDVEALPADLVARALDGGEMPAEERRRVGLALLTGEGAPRAREAGLSLLEGLADAGEPALALDLADALAEADPEAAYAYALTAAADGVPGATTRLARLESALPFAAVMRLQGEALDAGPAGPGEPLSSLEMREMRRLAERRLAGRGLSRSYLLAATFARLGAAQDDARSQGILERIDELAAAAPEGDREAWAALEAEASERALDAWTRLGPAEAGSAGGRGEAGAAAPFEGGAAADPFDGGATEGDRAGESRVREPGGPSASDPGAAGGAGAVGGATTDDGRGSDDGASGDGSNGDGSGD